MSSSVRDTREGGGSSPTHAPPAPLQAALTLLPSMPVPCRVTCAQACPRPRGQAGDGGIPSLTCWLCEPPGSPWPQPPGLCARGEAVLCSQLCRARGPTGLSVGSVQGPGGRGGRQGDGGLAGVSWVPLPCHSPPVLSVPGGRSGWKQTRLRGREETGARSAPSDPSRRAVGARCSVPHRPHSCRQHWLQGP